MRRKIKFLVLTTLINLNVYASTYELKNASIYETALSSSTIEDNNKKLSIKANKQLRMAKAAYKRYDYKNCLSLIKDYERTLKKIAKETESEICTDDKLLIAVYKAFSRKFMNNYESAIDSFKEVIELLEEINPYQREFLWSAYYHKASCYWGIKKKSKCKESLEKLAKMDMGLTFSYLKENYNKIIRQPNLLPTESEMKKDELIINKSLVNQLAEEILIFHKNGALIPKNCKCANKGLKGENSKYCTRLSNYAAIAASLISDINMQVKVLLALIEFEINALESCENCLKNDPGVANLNYILENVLNTYLKIDEDEEDEGNDEYSF